MTAEVLLAVGTVECLLPGLWWSSCTEYCRLYAAGHHSLAVALSLLLLAGGRAQWVEEVAALTAAVAAVVVGAGQMLSEFARAMFRRLRLELQQIPRHRLEVDLALLVFQLSTRQFR